MNEKNKQLFMIGNAHIDPVWLWRWQEGFQETKATYRSALDRLNEYEDAVFTASTVCGYKWIEENEPKMFEEIKQRVKEGRWLIVGGWWVEPDCNLPCGEAFVRQSLLGQRYLIEKFGVKSNIGYNIDSFGHCGVLPQILKKSGFDNYVFMRPNSNENPDLPADTFWWKSDDGSSVLTFRIKYRYCTKEIQFDEHLQKSLDNIPSDLGMDMCFYGVGNHGGGPTKTMIEKIIDRIPKEETKISFATPKDYFDAVMPNANKIPVVKGDLQYHAIGCYSQGAEIKKLNRITENAVLKAEKFASIADMCGLISYPDGFGQAWENLLFNQFHDILAGTSIESAYDDFRHSNGEAISIATRATNSAIQAISWNTDIPFEEGMLPIVVFNPHAFSVETPITVNTLHNKNIGVTDHEGNTVLSQQIESKHISSYEFQTVFNATIPPMGVRVYKLYPERAVSEIADRSRNYIENSKYKLEYNKTNISLFDKEGNVLVEQVAKMLVVFDDGDTWGHERERFDNILGYFVPETVQLVESGPVFQTLRVKSRYMSSELYQDFSLYEGHDYVEVKSRLDFREDNNTIKVFTSAGFENAKCICETPYGVIERPLTLHEETCQAWVDISGETRGISVINDCKYSFSAHKSGIYMTVLRSKPYADHDPENKKDYQLFTPMERGLHSFSLIIAPHEGDWKNSSADKLSKILNQPIEFTPETYHKGKLKPIQSYLECNNDGIEICALKLSHDKDGYILRVRETLGSTINNAVIKLSLIDTEIKTNFSPFEIKTYKLTKGLAPIETDLLEMKI